MCGKGQRRFHKLNEWSGLDNPTLPNFISWARTLPYAQELIFIDEIKKSEKDLLMEDGQKFRNLMSEINALGENALWEDIDTILEKYLN